MDLLSSCTWFENEGLTHFWPSAHYGIAGWNRKHDFYQVIITEDEGDIVEGSSDSHVTYESK